MKETQIDESYEKLIYREEKKLVESLLNVRDITEACNGGLCTIEFEEIAVALINSVQIKDHPLPEIQISKLRLFRSIIEMQTHSESPTNAADWSSEDYQKNK